MRSANRTCLNRSCSSFIRAISALAASVTLSSAQGCSADKPTEKATNVYVASGKKTLASVRAERRAFDGAPPVIPHEKLGASCTACHSKTGIQFGAMGFAPPMPHDVAEEMGKFSRCEQCHVYVQTQELFVENTFWGLRQDLRRGRRLNEHAPPVLPHPVFMRENCTACHTGPAAREEIRCTHPERLRCLQCHVPVVEAGEFER